jgi:DNA-directed RNA polymerase subunit P
MSELASIVYECARCGTRQSLEELSRYPELKCKNCGYRILKKVRSPGARKLERAT